MTAISSELSLIAILSINKEVTKMKKTYENPGLIALELYALDVLTASINHSDLDKEDNEKSDDNAVFWD